MSSSLRVAPVAALPDAHIAPAEELSGNPNVRAASG